jgi:hypothetical protein
MNRVFTLICLAFATAACSIATPVKKPKPSSANTAKTAHTAAKAPSRNAPSHYAARSRTASTMKVKYVRGRNGKLIRRARVAPAPSYQLHPDPDRYQQIQQALAGKGYFKGEVNGQWGDDSVDALKRFQADQKLDDDGHLSALTLIGLGLGPKHDGDVGKAAAPFAPAMNPTVPPNSVPKTAPAISSSPSANPSPTAGSPPPDSTGKS